MSGATQPSVFRHLVAVPARAGVTSNRVICSTSLRQTGGRLGEWFMGRDGEPLCDACGADEGH